ncbi:NIPSNAP family protein [Haloferula sp. BvORR071]|uniref:NIPSNAP family protein n=1 Tax=Haloferula sp. BvORR071 TaxID=1396141 RepID=UPI000556F5B9|nr:NIPSNAP family protein [Haloferula sp. BvORR071]
MFKALAVGLAVLGMSFTATAQEKQRLYELRTYHAEPGKLDALLTRFRDHTCKLFEKHGMTNVAYFVPVDNADNLLVYLLAYPDKEARDKAWKEFGSDEEWKKVVAESEANGKLVGKVDELYLMPTEFSPGFAPAAAGAPDRLFEMRTYTTGPGNLPALHQRFKNHTIELFKKHGITNMSYFRYLGGQPGAENTLLYFLAHKDAETASSSWTNFRADPVWVAAKKASEDAAGGSLTVLPDGVKSVFLKPVDFSPVK